MFSGRVPASLDPGPWARRLQALTAAGRSLLDLTDHNPTDIGLGDPLAGWLRTLSSPDARAASRRYAPHAAGLATAREAVAAYYADHGATISPGQVILTAGTSEAYAHAFRLLADAGDAFLAPRPSYPLFEPLATAEAVRLVPYPLRHQAGVWQLDLTAVAPARGLIVVHPNHPTGSSPTIEEARAVAGLCAREAMALIADEVFLDSMANGPRAATLAPSFATLADFGPLTLVFSGLSKVCGLPQLKCGWIVVTGPAALRDPAIERLAWLADAFLSVNLPVQLALPSLLAERHAFQRAVRARVVENRAFLAAAIGHLPRVELLEADGGWSAVVTLPAERADEEWALAMLEHDVVVHPGYFYDFEEPGRLVLSLLPRPERFAEAVSRIARVVRESSGD